MIDGHVHDDDAVKEKNHFKFLIPIKPWHYKINWYKSLAYKDNVYNQLQGITRHCLLCKGGYIILN